VSSAAEPSPREGRRCAGRRPMRCQKPLPPSAGRTVAVIQLVKGGGQLECEAVVDSEAVGGQLAAPADRGGGKGTDPPPTRRRPALPRPANAWCSVRVTATAGPAVTAIRAPRRPWPPPRRSQIVQQAPCDAPGRGQPRRKQHRPSRSQDVMAQLVHQHGHQLVLRQSIRLAVLHVPAGTAASQRRRL
jgi:hypothetical protein